MKIYYANISPLYNKEAFHIYEQKLPVYLMEKVRSITSDKKKVESLGGYTLLCMALRYAGYNGEVKLVYGKNGKPYLENADLYFNISHSGEYVACAVDDVEVGIDIEKVREVKHNIAERYFTVEEQRKVSTAECGTDEAFISAWVLKESLAKAKGGTIVEELSKGEIVKTTEKNQFTVYGSEFSLNLCDIEMKDYKMAVCRKGGKTIYSIEKIEL